MRARLFVVSSFAVAAVLGAASAAHAKPQGPGDIKYNPQPTTTTTAPPKGPDDFAPQPTTSTTTPPEPPKPADTDPTTVGDDEEVVVTPTTAKPVVLHSEPAPIVEDNNTATPTPAVEHESSSVPTIAIVLVAGIVGALLALLAGRVRRDDDEHANQV